MLDVSQLSDYAKSLIAPISAAEPCGENPKSSNEYDFAKGEVAKNSGRDYTALKQACLTVILKQSKDLTAFGYLTLALSQTDGIQAACDALAAMCYVSSTHWDAVHPQRPVGRMNAIKWLNEEKILGIFERLTPISSDQASVDAALLGLDDLKDLCFKHFPETPPSIKGLQQILKKWSQDLKAASAPAPAPVQAPTPKAVSPSGSNESESEVESTPSANSVGSLDSKSDAQRILQKVAFFYLQAEPQNVLGFKLLRLLKWQELTAEPKSEGGKTLIAGPNPARVKFFEGLAQSSDWDGILAKSEQALTEPGFHFWFDLQFMVCKALRGKGGAYIACAEAVELELSKLLQRVPNLASLSYKDGTAFASPLTLEWLEGLQGAGSGSGGGKSQSKAIVSVSLQEDFEKATQLALAQKMEEAVELLQSGMEFGNLREKTERRLSIAKLCAVHKALPVAEHILSDLCALIQSKGLDEWVPDFVAEILDLRIRNLNQLLRSADANEKQVWTEKADYCWNWLCKVSPTHAVRIK